MRHYHQFLFTCLAAFGPIAESCIGGGSGGSSCCAAAPCAPSIPVCSSYGSSYSSYSAGGSYAAPQASYPRPLSYSAPCGQSSSGGCGSVAAPQISILAPAPAPQPIAPPISGYAQPIGPSYSAPLPPPPLPPQPVPQPIAQPYNSNIPPPNPGPELETNYEDNNQQVSPPGSNQGLPPPQPYNEQNTGVDYHEAAPPPSASVPLAKPVYDGIGSTASTDYTDEQNSVQPTGDASQPSSTGPTDEATLNCEDGELRKIVESALLQSGDNLDAARKIESEAAARFGGRFNSIVSNSEFAFVNWYGKRNCQLRVNDRHSLTWED
ncbi:Ground-like domain-containing protein [Aphelenchoides besseyi]|nr:Ground-like domain-containing protein [Aphelenchoides besseyi]